MTTIMPAVLTTAAVLAGPAPASATRTVTASSIVAGHDYALTGGA
ncbi:hypothetical protein ACFO1B_29225 [Dactylosporangium siamense]|uniref:Uncharacterized protein n=1 Tax=Dactylosporangium siamense TaxID=685454 RepID=A0A919PY98_9ACTN|nr:hypothetical protein [Dactylosporangium siamense]GIG51872.1 hypothetical protein Dsi01nite_099130 [Dactylosporangium siamense]